MDWVSYLAKLLFNTRSYVAKIIGLSTMSVRLSVRLLVVRDVLCEVYSQYFEFNLIIHMILILCVFYYCSSVSFAGLCMHSFKFRYKFGYLDYFMFCWLRLAFPCNRFMMAIFGRFLNFGQFYIIKMCWQATHTFLFHYFVHHAFKCFLFIEFLLSFQVFFFIVIFTFGISYWIYHLDVSFSTIMSIWNVIFVISYLFINWKILFMFPKHIYLIKIFEHIFISF